MRCYPFTVPVADLFRALHRTATRRTPSRRFLRFLRINMAVFTHQGQILFGPSHEMKTLLDDGVWKVALP